jgi:thiamine biosynthesis lipoprotein ApbE
VRAALLAALLAAPPASAGLLREVRLVMGTTAEVRATGEASTEAGILEAFAALRRADEHMSLWKESEVPALDREGTEVVSEDTLAVLRHALDVAAASGGAFDPTVEPLVLGLRDPTGERRPWGSFRVEDTSVSTSAGDQKPGHILDPRTGEPARGALAATVVAGSGIEDALSTALVVLGPDVGLALLARRRAAGLVLLEKRGRRIVRATPGFAARYALAVAPGVEVRE